MFGPDSDRTHGELVSPYDEPLYEHMTALNTRMAAAGARTVVSGLGGDEMVAVGSAESAQAALAHRGSPAGLRPDLNAVEGAWASMKSSLGNHAATSLDELEVMVRSRLRSIQRRPDLINALLGQTGLTLQPPPP
jgi:hypothetical protein